MTNDQATLDKLDRMRLHGMGAGAAHQPGDPGQCTAAELLRLADCRWEQHHQD